jgi:hypothetical protein
MLIKLFSCLVELFREEENPCGSFTQAQIHQQRMYPPLPVNSARHDELIKDFPFVANFIFLHDVYGSNSTKITFETLDVLYLKKGIDYEIDRTVLYFKTEQMKIDFNKTGYTMSDDGSAACAFERLDKKRMGTISFTHENIFYITIRPRYGKELELLKEVTLFYKGHGYPIYDPTFQENFCSYKDFAIMFYVKDEAMAAELNFYVTSKDLGTIL